MADGQISFAFMRKYRDLFAGAPVFFCAMNRPERAMLEQCGECSGVPLEPDIYGTVDLIFSLRPNTRLVVGIMDGSARSFRLRSQLEAVMESHMNRSQLVFPGFEPGDETGLTMESLASVASSVPGTGAVIFLGFSEDANGNGLDEIEAVAALAQRSAGPVFVLNDGWFGTGVLGGSVAQARAHGHAVSLLVLQAQAGEPVREMLPPPVAPHVVFDGTVLARFGMTKWPTDATLVNQPGHPRAEEGIISTGLLWWAFGVTALIGLLLVVRRFTGSRYRKSE